MQPAVMEDPGNGNTAEKDIRGSPIGPDIFPTPHSPEQGNKPHPLIIAMMMMTQMIGHLRTYLPRRVREMSDYTTLGNKLRKGVVRSIPTAEDPMRVRPSQLIRSGADWGLNPKPEMTRLSPLRPETQQAKRLEDDEIVSRSNAAPRAITISRRSSGNGSSCDDNTGQGRHSCPRPARQEHSMSAPRYIS